MDSTAVKTQAGFIIFVLGMLTAAPLQAADFYAGKTIDFVIGGNPGGGFDIYARALVRHLSRHIPGGPAIVAKNMPGAGSAKAGIHVATIAPKDGLTIGAVTPGAITGPLLDDRPNALFAPNKVIWIGSADSASRVCATYQTSKIKRFEDMLARRTVIGGGSHGDATHDYAHMISKVTNAKIDVVAGYKGTLDTTLAMERGEIDGMCGWGWSSLKSQKPEWVRDGKLNVVLQIGPHDNPELTKLGAPLLWQFVKDDDSRRVAEVIVSQQAFTRPYFVAMGTPAPAMNILRQAFDATTTDAEFLADAAKLRVDVSPLPGVEVQRLVEAFYATPHNIVEQARRAIRP
jgi:tripartite-type tricarboxylate transporter receptor subunit TctC